MQDLVKAIPKQGCERRSGPSLRKYPNRKYVQLFKFFGGKGSSSSKAKNATLNPIGVACFLEEWGVDEHQKSVIVHFPAQVIRDGVITV